MKKIIKIENKNQNKKLDKREKMLYNIDMKKYNKNNNKKGGEKMKGTIEQIEEIYQKIQVSDEEVQKIIDEYRKIEAEYKQLIKEHAFEMLLAGFYEDKKLYIDYEDYQKHKDNIRKYFWWDKENKVWRLKNKIDFAYFMNMLQEGKNYKAKRGELWGKMKELKGKIRNYVYVITYDAYETYTSKGFYFKKVAIATEKVAKFFAPEKAKFNEKYNWYEWSWGEYGY